LVLIISLQYSTHVQMLGTEKATVEIEQNLWQAGRQARGATFERRNFLAPLEIICSSSSSITVSKEFGFIRQQSLASAPHHLLHLPPLTLVTLTLSVCVSLSSYSAAHQLRLDLPILTSCLLLQPLSL
jgi:hypothetical protein